MLLFMDLQNTLDTRETAARLGVSRRTVTRMAEDGRLHPAKVPGYRGAFLFDPNEVQRVAESLKPQSNKQEVSV